MHNVNRCLELLKPLVTMLVATQISGCYRTVQWEEEVPLNTGETIWVTRSVVYSLQGTGGNPMDVGLHANNSQTLSFKWRNHAYQYKGSAGIILIAISSKLEPVLVAPAAFNRWDWSHDYYCAVPHYVQLVPDATGHGWTWPPAIEPWLYGLPANLMIRNHKAGEIKSRYTVEQRAAEDSIVWLESPYLEKIDPNYLSDPKSCKRRN